MLRAEAITIRYNADGSPSADHFPVYVAMSPELLAHGDPELLHVGWVGLNVEILGVRYVVVGKDFAGLTMRRVDDD